MRSFVLIFAILGLSSAMSSANQTLTMQNLGNSLVDKSVCIVSVLGLPAVAVAHSLRICPQHDNWYQIVNCMFEALGATFLFISFILGSF
jgi:hypothetical protein